MLKAAQFLAHIEAAATAGAAGIVGFFSTFLGQGVPSHGVQLQVAAVFACFTWLAALWHRFKSSPAQAEAVKLASEAKAGAWSVDDALRFINDATPFVRELMKGPPAAAGDSKSYPADPRGCTGCEDFAQHVERLIADLTPAERAILEKRGVIPAAPTAKGA